MIEVLNIDIRELMVVVAGLFCFVVDVNGVMLY